MASVYDLIDHRHSVSVQECDIHSYACHRYAVYLVITFFKQGEHVKVGRCCACLPHGEIAKVKFGTGVSRYIW